LLSGNLATASHTYADGPNQYTIHASSTNDDGTFAAAPLSVTVLNVAPTLVLLGPGSVNEGSLYTLHLSSSDPGQDTIAHWTIRWGDGTPDQTVSGNPSTV